MSRRAHCGCLLQCRVAKPCDQDLGRRPILSDATMSVLEVWKPGRKYVPRERMMQIDDVSVGYENRSCVIDGARQAKKEVAVLQVVVQ